MFIGEFGCCIPLIWRYYTTPTKTNALPPQASVFTRILARLPLGTGPTTAPDEYRPVAETEDSSDDDDVVVSIRLEPNDALTGCRVCWMWFPAFFDSKSLILLT